VSGVTIRSAYTARHPTRVDSLVFSSSSLGVGEDWKRTKREPFRTDRMRAVYGEHDIFGSAREWERARHRCRSAKTRGTNVTSGMR
jgi:hypothetical protein